MMDRPDMDVRNVDWVGSIIAREKSGHSRVAATYCRGCPIKGLHRADFAYVIADGTIISVCGLGLNYQLEKECRRL